MNLNIAAIRRIFMSKASLLCTVFVVSACSPPLSLVRLSLNESYKQVDQSALSGDALSASTLNVLRRHALLTTWNQDPNAAIADLRGEVVGQETMWSDLFALAELSYLEGKRQNTQDAFLAAAVYAYAFLDPGIAQDKPNPYDERFRQASNIYNLALTAAFNLPGGSIQMIPGLYKLPFGDIDLTLAQSQQSWHGRALVNFEPTAILSVTGLQNTYRYPGLGEPLAVMPAAPPQSSLGLEVPEKVRVPANLLMVIDAPRQQLAQSHLTGRLLLNTIDERQSVQIGQETVPLEYDQTVARALGLTETSAWSNEYRGFLNGSLFDRSQSQLVALEPHQFGRMPVVLVHGTASSPFRWADMVNDLLENPTIRDHFEFWFFSYATGNPIPYSALQLRRSIEQTVSQLGGVAADPALGEMTLIGHSQGGLLVKMLVINPGDRLWNGVSRAPLASLTLSNKSRSLVQQSLFPKPLPEVKRVIFIATPQRGSYVAAFSITHLIGRLVSLPLAVTQAGKELLTGNSADIMIGRSKLQLGSVYGMSPNNPFIKTLATIPVIPAVHVHSIIPVQTNGPLQSASDGVVQYASAHIGGVDSELVVRSGHSTQSNPQTIAEVQRILMLQLAAAQADGAAGP